LKTKTLLARAFQKTVFASSFSQPITTMSSKMLKWLLGSSVLIIVLIVYWCWLKPHHKCDLSSADSLAIYTTYGQSHPDTNHSADYHISDSDGVPAGLAVNIPIPPGATQLTLETMSPGMYADVIRVDPASPRVRWTSAPMEPIPVTPGEWWAVVPNQQLYYAYPQIIAPHTVRWTLSSESIVPPMILGAMPTTTGRSITVVISD
jgi:hypothetical protein